MNIAHRLGLRGTLITLGVVLALAAVVTTSNTPVHASSHPDLQVGTHVLATPPTSARVPNPNEPSIGHRSARRARKLSKEERR
jgi:hypothetical protein